MKTDVDSCLKDIANWYVKNRRNLTDKELHGLLYKHCSGAAEIKKFTEFMQSAAGKRRFSTLLGEMKPSRLNEPKEDWQMTREEMKSRLPEGMKIAGAKELFEWEKVNYNEPTLIGATTHKVTGKGIVASYHSKYNKARLAKQEEILSNLHKESITQALSEGKPVPPRVLKDYPELSPKTSNPTIPEGLKASIGEEQQAQAAYHERGTEAKDFGDTKTAKLYGHVAGEEKQHEGEFRERLEQLRNPSRLKEQSMFLPTGQKCEAMSPQYYHLLSWFNLPLPDYSFSIEPEAKERKIDLVLKQLQQGVERIHQSDVYRQLLVTMSKFHQYSFGNQILIMMQSPYATKVAGFATWKEVGRWVKRGEEGIAILAPCLAARQLSCPLCSQSGFMERTLRAHLSESHHRMDVTDLIKEAKGEGEADMPTFFKVVYVFDVSQTDGKELPDVEVPSLTGEANEELFTKLMDLAKTQGLIVSFESRPFMPTEIKGEYRRPKDIWVRPEESRAQQLKTLAHEEAHHFTESVFGVPRADAETIAESVAFVVSAHWGFDTGTRSFPYVALWAKDKGVLQKNLNSIREISERMIKAIGGSNG